MEIELPPGLRIGRRIREVQVDANGRPLFFLLCFPCLDRHCCCNVAGSAHQLTLFRALGSALFEIRVAVTRPPFCERREEQEGQKCEGEAERETWCWTRVRLSLYNTTLSRFVLLLLLSRTSLPPFQPVKTSPFEPSRIEFLLNVQLT